MPGNGKVLHETTWQMILSVRSVSVRNNMFCCHIFQQFFFEYWRQVWHIHLHDYMFRRMFYLTHHMARFCLLVSHSLSAWHGFIFPLHSQHGHMMSSVQRIQHIVLTVPCGSLTWYTCDFSLWRPPQQHLTDRSNRVCHEMLGVALAPLMQRVPPGPQTSWVRHCI